MKRFLRTAMTSVALLVGGNAVADSLKGQVLDRDNRPVPGVQVSLVHREFGRISSVYTSAEGRYFVPDLPRSEELWYIEVYWGTELVFRGSQTILGDIDFDIHL